MFWSIACGLFEENIFCLQGTHLLEGKYWRRQDSAIIAEYMSWRWFYKLKVSSDTMRIEKKNNRKCSLHRLMISCKFWHRSNAGWFKLIHRLQISKTFQMFLLVEATTDRNESSHISLKSREINIKIWSYGFMPWLLGWNLQFIVKKNDSAAACIRERLLIQAVYAGKNAHLAKKQCVYWLRATRFLQGNGSIKRNGMRVKLSK